MPSTITHSYMAKDIYNKLNPKIRKIIKIDNYITYSQGPDIFFFYPFIPPFIKCAHIRKFAGVVHRNKVNELFISLINDIKKDKDFDKFTFLSGLITHYVGDSLCHPLVNYKAWLLKKKNNNNKDYHFLIEAYIDNYILNINGEYYKNYKCFNLLNAHKNEKIKDMLDRSFKKVFKEKNIGKYYFLSLKNMKFLFYLIRYDPYKIKKIAYKIIYFILPFLKQDIRYFSYNFDLNDKDSIFILNLNHDKWFNIKKRDVSYNKSFLDLYKEVINKSTYMIQEIYDYIYNDKKIELNTFFGNLSYANGLPIKVNKKHISS